jgi:hypothetical protein
VHICACSDEGKHLHQLPAADAEATAGRLADMLDRDRYRVFIDVDMEPAVPWRDEIQLAVGNCAVLLAVIGQDWLEVKDAHGRRRLDNSDDVVRFEIEAALQRDVLVIPILIDHAAMPESSELPTSLRALAGRMAEYVRNDRFADDCRHLKGVIDKHMKSPPYARALSAIAGLLLVLAAASFMSLPWVVPGGPGFFAQIGDFALAAGFVVLGAGLLVTQSRWKNTGWLATAGLCIGLLPFLSLRMWRSTELLSLRMSRGKPRRGEGLFGLEGPLALILLALVLIVLLALVLIGILLVRNPEVAFARPRVFRDPTATVIVFGVAALIGLAAIGVALPTPRDNFTSGKFSDPMLLYVAVLLAIIAAVTQGLPRAAVLAGWTGGAAGVLATTVFFRLRPKNIPEDILDKHLLLSILTVAILATITVLALRKS